MAVPPVSTTISHSPRSLRDRTRREDRHLKFYELRDNLARARSTPIVAAIAPSMRLNAPAKCASIRWPMIVHIGCAAIIVIDEREYTIEHKQKRKREDWNRNSATEKTAPLHRR